MPKYKIKKTGILKDGKVFAEGSEIELTQKEAGKLSDFLIPVEAKKADCEQRLKGGGDKPSTVTPFNANNQEEPKKEETKKTAAKAETKTPDPKTAETTTTKKEEAKK